MKKSIRQQRDLASMINDYQQAYWLARSLEARNTIAIKLWSLRYEANANQHLLQCGNNRMLKTEAHQPLGAKIAAIFKMPIAS